MMLSITLVFLLQFALTLIYLFTFRKLSAGLEILNSNTKRAEWEKMPFVSLIISMHNEQHNIPGLLDCLGQLKYPADRLEILLIDDRSQDETYHLLTRNDIKHFAVRILQISETAPDFAPKKYAITQAVKQAQGDILLFTDADGRPGSTWVTEIISLFSENTGMVLGYAPYMTNPPYNGFIFRLLALEYLSHAAISAATAGLGYPASCVGTNMAYRKVVFENLDGFGPYKHIHTGDDDLFLQRVREETDWGITYATSAESQVWNAPPADVKKFYNQRLRYASKGFLYPITMRLSLVLFYLYNLLTALNLILAFIYPIWFTLYLVLLLSKFTIDFAFMSKAGYILNDKRNLILIPLALLGHIPYVLYFGFMAQVQSFKWAGRKG